MSSKVVLPEKKSPFSGRKYRVVEVRYPDLDQIMGYELQAYSQNLDKWFGMGFHPRKEEIIKEYEQNTGPI